MDDLSRFCCLNSDCPEYGRRGADNLTVPHRYGPDKSRRMLRFCWAVRTLRVKAEDRTWQQRTPAMAAGPADHVRPLSEWLTLPAVHQR